MYLNHTLVLESFKRLGVNTISGKRGKTHMERTSSLMIMLALDAATKQFGVQALNVDFSNEESVKMRKALSLEYSKLVTVSKSEDGGMQSVHELGYVHIGGKDPEQRMSSNFLTTHVPNATDYETAFEYPHRPAPLLHLGKVATRMPYGIQLHPEWQDGFVAHLADVASNTPFTDLAMFCMRYVNAEKKATLTDTLCAMIRERYTKDVADYWVGKIKGERLFAKHLKTDEFMEAEMTDSLATINNMQSRRAELMKYDKEQPVDSSTRAEGAKKN